jgi:hypothetical protein
LYLIPVLTTGPVSAPTPAPVGSNWFFNWEDFRDEFRKEFTPAHAELAAVSQLESTAYFQKGRPLDEYLDKFRNLLADSGYTNPKTAVFKFRQGLNTQMTDTGEVKSLAKTWLICLVFHQTLLAGSVSILVLSSCSHCQHLW